MVLILVSFVLAALAMPEAHARFEVSAGDSCLNLRARSTSRSRTKACLPTGTDVTILKSGKYYYVKTASGQKGYVHSRYIRKKNTETARRETPQRTVAETAKETVPMPVRKELPPAQVQSPAQAPEGEETVASAADAATNAERSTMASAQGGMCSADGGFNAMDSVKSVISEGIIPAKRGYSMKSASVSKIEMDGSQVQVSFGPGKSSHCSSFSRTAFLKQLADLHNSGQMKLEERHVKFLGGKEVFEATYGNTMSMAALYQELGGTTLYGEGRRADMVRVLQQAKPGDSLQIGRKNGTGHNTFFDAIDWKKGEVCYYSSNGKTKGAARQCESFGVLSQVAVARLPVDPSQIPARIDAIMGSQEKKNLLLAGNRSGKKGLKKNQIAWSKSLGECKSPGPAAAPRGIASDSSRVAI